MRIVRPHDRLLIVRVRPAFIEWIFGLAALMPFWMLLKDGFIKREDLPMVFATSVISALVTSYISEVTDFVFDGDRNELRWRRTTVFRKVGGVVAFGDIRDVDVVSHLTPSGDYYVHSVVLTVPSGALRLTRYSMTGKRSERVAKAILDFLNEQGFPPGSEASRRVSPFRLYR